MEHAAWHLIMGSQFGDANHRIGPVPGIAGILLAGPLL
jgi:hypothetical protein